MDIGEPLFQPFPPEIIFRGYEPYHTYEILLTLRNNDKVARRIKLLPPSVPLFGVGVPADQKASGKDELGNILLSISHMNVV